MVYCLGESLVDVIVNKPDNALLKAGGGMLNTAVSLGRSGIDVSLISEVGDDKTAELIIDFLLNNHVNITCVKKYYHQNTSIAMAYLDHERKPTYSIHKAYPMNRRIISPKKFTKDDILIFGSLYSLDPLIRSEVLHILSLAKNDGATLIYDPNIRRHKIEGEELTKALQENISFANIIKASDEDMVNVFGKASAEFYWEEIKKINNKAVFILTRGEKGALGFMNGKQSRVSSIFLEVVSTIGAGDAFNAGMAFYLQSLSPKNNLWGGHFELDGLMKMGTKFSAAVCGSMENYVNEGFSPA